MIGAWDIPLCRPLTKANCTLSFILEDPVHCTVYELIMLLNCVYECKLYVTCKEGLLHVIQSTM